MILGQTWLYAQPQTITESQVLSFEHEMSCLRMPTTCFCAWILSHFASGKTFQKERLWLFGSFEHWTFAGNFEPMFEQWLNPETEWLKSLVKCRIEHEMFSNTPVMPQFYQLTMSSVTFVQWRALVSDGNTWDWRFGRDPFEMNTMSDAPNGRLSAPAGQIHPRVLFPGMF